MEGYSGIVFTCVAYKWCVYNTYSEPQNGQRRAETSEVKTRAYKNNTIKGKRGQPSPKKQHKNREKRWLHIYIYISSLL